MDQLIPFINNHWPLCLAFVIILALLLLLELLQKWRGVPVLSARAATQLINREDAIVLDIRDSNSYGRGHIAGAINIERTQLASSLDKLFAHQTKPIIVAGQTDQHARECSTLLAKNGFEKIYLLKGGIQAWQTESLPLVKS